jgi:hypothetical protein
VRHKLASSTQCGAPNLTIAARVTSDANGPAALARGNSVHCPWSEELYGARNREVVQRPKGFSSYRQKVSFDVVVESKEDTSFGGSSSRDLIGIVKGTIFRHGTFFASS